MSEPNPTRWAGVCSGAYFAAAAVYLGNIVALSAFHRGALLLALAMVCLPVICALMGGLVLAGWRRAPRWAVVVAGGFSAMHLIGLVYLFFLAPASSSPLTQSLQWQLATAFLFLWLCVLWSAFRLASVADSRGATARPTDPGPPGG